ncbi:MAG: hypothetical protein CVV03_01480 [Firmicutes bacterium HGW-Firmicutes-8]|nr:MAG: hypothetical protein CVV03_01480 [Firmicutes bacterium HGW-Firmicutes-8]
MEEVTIIIGKTVNGIVGVYERRPSLNDEFIVQITDGLLVLVHGELQKGLSLVKGILHKNPTNDVVDITDYLRAELAKTYDEAIHGYIGIFILGYDNEGFPQVFGTSSPDFPFRRFDPIGTTDASMIPKYIWTILFHRGLDLNKASEVLSFTLTQELSTGLARTCQYGVCQITPGKTVFLSDNDLQALRLKNSNAFNKIKEDNAFLFC